MPEWLKDLAEGAVKGWHTRTGLILALALASFGLLFLFSEIDFASLRAWQWSVIVISTVFIAVLWWRTHIPHVRRGKIGFAVAIDFEEPDQAKALRSDLIRTMRDILYGSDMHRQFHFIEVPQAVAARIDDADAATSLTHRANFSFLIYGRARRRTMPDGTETHVIDLQGLVRHAGIEKALSEQLGEDFRATLPNRVQFKTNGSFIACEFTAKHLDAVGRYILGSAAAFSDNLPLGEQLLIDSEARFKALIQGVKEPGLLTPLLNRIQDRIRELYSTWLNRLLLDYTQRRDNQLLERAEQIVKKLRVYDPESYLARTSSAMAAFVLRRDVESAKLELLGCGKLKDAAWMYGQAFLLAYDGDLESAYHVYKTAFSSPQLDETVPLQSEEFIHIILNEEAERVWLFYCLGLINYKAKQDLRAAHNDFSTFVSKADPRRFKKQIDISRRWIEEIEGKNMDS